MKIIKQILLYIIALSLTLLFCDVFLKQTYIVMVSSSDFQENTGRINRKNLNYIYFNEGMGIGQFNKFRYIGKARSPEKNDNTIRIALLGDSYVESFQVLQRHYFGNLMEQYLSGRYLDNNVEVLNFGRSGFNIADMYIYQKSFVRNFDPDFILYFLSNNDLTAERHDPLLPYLEIKNDSLVISLEFDAKQIEAFEKSKFFIHNSRISQILNSARKKMKPNFIIPLIFGKFAPETNNDPQEANEDFIPQPEVIKIIESADPEKLVIVHSGYDDIPEEILKVCKKKRPVYY